MQTNGREDPARDSDTSGDSRGGGRERRRATSLMTATLLAGVAGLVGLVGLVAWFLGGTSGPLPGFVEADGRVLVPAAAEEPARIGALGIRGQGNDFTLRRDDGDWTLSEADGYPARSGRVGAMLDTLGNLRAAYVSEDQSPPASDYGFGDLDGPSATAVGITLRGEDNAVLQRVTLGNVVTMPGGANLSNLALRRDDDPRIWLAESDLRVSADPFDWVDRRIFHTARDRVAEVVITAPDGEKLVIRRSEDSGALEVVEGLPPDASVEGPWVLEEIASVLENLEFVDAGAAKNLGGGGETWEARIRTADGILLAATIFPDKDRPWAKIRARATESSEAGRDRAREFNARHDEWAYRLPTYVTTRLMTRPAGLIDDGNRNSAAQPPPR